MTGASEGIGKAYTIEVTKTGAGMGVWRYENMSLCSHTAGETRSECCHHEQVSGKAGKSC